MTDINGLTNPFENSVNNQNLTQLEKEQQIRDYLEAITMQNYTVPTDVIVSLNQLIADDVVSLGAIDGFNLVLVEAFTNMLPGQFLEFTPDELLMLSPYQIAALSPDVFANMTFDLLSALSLDALGGITATQVAQISVDIFSQLTFQMFSALSPDALAAITPLQIAEVLVDVFAVLTSDLLMALSDSALAGVTAAQIAAFPVSEFAALTSAELTHLTPDAFLGITADQIAALPAGVFANLSGAQITALTPDALGGMTVDQFAALDPAVLQTLQDNGSVLAITSDGDELDGDLSAASFSMMENSKPVTIVDATSPLALTLTYALTGDDAVWFEIADDGTLSFRSAPDFENARDVGGDNTYDLTVEVSDGVQSDTQAISVTVTNDPGDDNVTAPQITSNGGGNSAQIQISENEFYVTTVTSYDPDPIGDEIYSFAGGPNDNLFQIDMISGVLTFNDAPDFENPQGVFGNSYEVAVQVSDGFKTDTQFITVEVQDVDEQSGPANVQYINEYDSVPNPDPFKIFFGTFNTADIFVFDASILNEGFADIQIDNFDISEDYLVFTNFELGGDYEPPISDLGQIFHENSQLGFNHVNFFAPGTIDVIQDQNFGQQFAHSVLNVSGIAGPADLANSFGPGFTDSGAAVTAQFDHVLFYADEFLFV